MIIDAHTHIYTNSKQVCKQEAKKLLVSMDECNIDYSVVMSFMGSKTDGKDYEIQRDTDNLINECNKSNRLFPIVMFDMDDYDLSCKSIEDYVSNDAVVAVKFMTGYQHFLPTAERLTPVLSFLEDNNVSAMFHTGVCNTSCSSSRLKYSSQPFEFDELAARYPTLKINCAHFNAPHFLALAAVFNMRPNLYADISGLFEGTYTEECHDSYKQLQYNLYDAMTYLPNWDTIMFGSDTPIWSQRDALDFFIGLATDYELANESVAKLLSQNAQDFYGLDLDD